MPPNHFDPRPGNDERSGSLPHSQGMLHEKLHRTEEIVAPSDRRFGLTIAAVCGVVAIVRFVLGHNHWAWWLGGAIAFAFFALVWPVALWPLNRLWLLLGLALYRIVNPVVMALLFASTITPIGMLMRLCGKDPLRLRREPSSATYWIKRQPSEASSGTMRNQF